MRKLLWTLALLLAAIGAPGVYADSFDASFTCTASCSAIPTDPFVTFPSPSLPITFFFQTFSITLNAVDTPTDTFTWTVGSNSGTWYFVLTDLTLGTSDDGPSFSINQSTGTPYGSGAVIFQSAPAPEPGALALTLLGVGLAFLGRKRLRRGTL